MFNTNFVRVSHDLFELLNLMLELSEDDITLVLLESTTYRSQEGGLLVNYISVSSEDGKWRYYDEKRYKALFTDMFPNTSSDYMSEVSLFTELLNGGKFSYSAKVGRVIRKLYGDKFTSQQIEEFVSTYKEVTTKLGKYDIRVVEGEAIREAYLIDNYSSLKSGQLHGSCMRHKKCQKYFDVYVNNPQSIKMVVCYDLFGKVAARSLLWYNDKEPVAFDRVYSIDNAHKFALQKYVKETFDIPNCYEDDNLRVRVDIKGGINDYEYFPYLDSLHYLEGETLTTHTEDRDYYTLLSVSGRYEEYEYDYCYSCDDSIEYEIIEYDGHSYCSHCVVFSEYQNIYIPEHLTVHTPSGYVHWNDAAFCELDEQHYPEGECVLSDYHDTHIPSSKSTVINGHTVWLEYVSDESELEE